MTISTKESFLASIQPDMSLNRAFFLKVYGYEISFPGFADTAIARLKILGCSRAREYYDRFVSEHEHRSREEMKEAAAWYAKRLERKNDRKAVCESRKQQELLMMKSKLLKKKLRLLKQRAAAQSLTGERSDP